MEMGNMESSRYFDLDTELDFGQNRGMTIEELFAKDPQYLVWMYENFEDTEWSADVEVLVTKAMDTDYDFYGDEFIDCYPNDWLD